MTLQLVIQIVITFRLVGPVAHFNSCYMGVWSTVAMKTSVRGEEPVSVLNRYVTENEFSGEEMAPKSMSCFTA
jgi:hypothetical protein